MRDGGGEGGLRAGVVGGAIDGGGSGCVAGRGVVVGGVAMEEGRELEDAVRIDGVQPGEEDSSVGLVLRVAELAGVELLGLEVGGAGVVGNLEEVLAKLGDEAELVLRGAVVEQGSEAADSVGGVVVDRTDGRGEAVVAAVAVEAGVVGDRWLWSPKLSWSLVWRSFRRRARARPWRSRSKPLRGSTLKTP